MKFTINKSFNYSASEELYAEEGGWGGGGRGGRAASLARNRGQRGGYSRDRGQSRYMIQTE